VYSLAAEVRLPLNLSFIARFFRQDEKERIAAVNTGAGPESWTPVRFHDPGPDGIYGTWDDNWKAVAYARDPASFGRDWFLLTNPKGLAMYNAAALGEIRYTGKLISGSASFAKMKSFGSTNPGNTAWQNDPNVLGSLFESPNNMSSSAGHSYFDHANVGKVSLVIGTGHPKWPTLGLVAVYTDGQPFNRRVLVTGLPQGPFLLNTTLRGSPEGGNRSEYMVNVDVRVSRAFPVRRAKVLLSVDVFNLVDGVNKIKESDATSPLFNSRPPLALQPPRSIRLGVTCSF
jgi:hypothetical protein